MIDEDNPLNLVSRELHGRDYGKVSKRDHIIMEIALARKIEEYQHIIYVRDLLYNPCHNLDEEIKLSKHLNNFEV